MRRLEEGIKKLSQRLDTYTLPEDKFKALEVAQDIDLLKEAKRIVLYYEKEEELNQTK